MADAGFHSLSLPFVESLYQDFLRDPRAVPPAWRGRFEGLAPDGGPASLQARADRLVNAYRVRGHRVARLDPLGPPPARLPELEAAFHGISAADLDRPVSAGTVHGAGRCSLREALKRLKRTYCGSIGVQFMHIDEIEIRGWLQKRMEESENRADLGVEEQRRILKRLTDAAVFEEFLAKRFLGAKRFSLEGAESLLPLLESAIERAAAAGVQEIVVAMAHRGRLNVLANIMGKSPGAIFREFARGTPAGGQDSGDVKYHLGCSRDWRAASGREVHLSLLFTPSHVEFADPVALGRARAKQDRAGDRARRRVLAVLIHGDAAFAGEGVVQETLNLSQLDAYSVGGALHVIVNNRIGFTTEPAQGFSGVYPTDVARMLQVPIFHVNGEEPEAVAQALDLAMEFRGRWRRDAVVDMFCYRRHGHNETDEPAFTQPLLYKRIRARKPVRQSYLKRLLRLGGVSRREAEELERERVERLERELKRARGEESLPESAPLMGVWNGYRGGPESGADEPATGVPEPRLRELLERMTSFPEGFRVHPKILKGMERRREMARGERPVDWAAAEALAFCSLAAEGVRVRLTGQDSERGTFSHRHAVLHDHEDGRTYEPYSRVAEGQAPVEIRNSPLSELAVLGFEYGYSLDSPDALVLWEAQYGDFANAAQVVFDQFLACAEAKWSRLSGLVVLLPHGFEGEGPEHSSARLERLLLLSAGDNMQVAQPATSAQYFHLLRRQALRRWRKPLAVLTPKSLLRHPAAASGLAELAGGRFQKVLSDPPAGEKGAAGARRVLLCSGKVYYELLARRGGSPDVGLIRLEQLYPFPETELKRALGPYPEGTPAVWVQEEPENMGAWRTLRLRAGDRLLGRHPFTSVSRPESASPATGSKEVHKREQERILEEAFRL